MINNSQILIVIILLLNLVLLILFDSAVFGDVALIIFVVTVSERKDVPIYLDDKKWEINISKIKID